MPQAVEGRAHGDWPATLALAETASGFAFAQALCRGAWSAGGMLAHVASILLRQRLVHPM